LRAKAQGRHTTVDVLAMCDGKTTLPKLPPLLESVNQRRASIVRTIGNQFQTEGCSLLRLADFGTASLAISPFLKPIAQHEIGPKLAMRADDRLLRHQMSVARDPIANSTKVPGSGTATTPMRYEPASNVWIN
jgi:hypothetical protein